MVDGPLRKRLQVPCLVADGLPVFVDDVSRSPVLARNVLLEARTEDGAWMKGKGAHSVLLATLIQCHREKNISRLRLTISRPSVLLAVLEVGVIEHERGIVMPPGRHRNHPCTVGRPQSWP
jgi:hypothetical protein